MIQPSLPRLRALALLACLFCASLAAAAEPAFRAPETLRPGDPIFAWYLAEEPLSNGTLELRTPAGRLLAARPLFELPAESPLFAALAEGRPKVYGCILGLPFELAAADFELRLAGEAPSGRVSLSRKLRILAHVFAAEEIALDKANTALRTEPDPRKEAEAKRIHALYAAANPSALHLAPGFSSPLESTRPRRSAGFGDRRVYRYFDGSRDTSWHAGIDFAVPTGTRVLAPASGRVVMAEDRIVTGKTLVLEHLPGLYSTYMHLCRFLVSPGELVERGRAVAETGSTGLSTGPHLHWEIRAAGYPVDPDFLAAGPGLGGRGREELGAEIPAPSASAAPVPPSLPAPQAAPQAASEAPSQALDTKLPYGAVSSPAIEGR